MAGRVEGKVAFITGAARGQGRSHAVRLAEEGADIIAIDICAQIDSVPYPLATPEDLAETVAAVEALDRRIVAREADVRDFAAVKAAVDEGVAELGRVDIVVANAGIGSYALAVETTADAWRDTIDTDLTGEWHAVKAAVPHMQKAGEGGSIVLTSSAVGLYGIPHLGAYVAAKHGLVGLMKTLAIELAPESIRVNTVHPGGVNTPMVINEPTFDLFFPGEDRRPTVEEVGERMGALHALPIPWLEPIDISNAVLFLASEEARYVTGVTFPVDAGQTLHAPQ